MKTWAIAALAMLAGCQVVDTGVIDFRRAEVLSEEDLKTRKTRFIADCTFEPDHAKLTTCDPMLPARLFDKQLSTPANYILPDEYYSIRLDFGVIADMAEWPKITSRGLKTNGEIAVLVNAFEVSDKTSGEKFMDFSQANDSTTTEGRQLGEFANAKVVYFNPDVDEGQALNLSNIPIHGPAKYEGGPIGLQIIVIELDRMTPATRALLGQLAELGKIEAGLTNPAASTLFELGKSMINGAQDDIIFEYRMMMDNGTTLKVRDVSAFQSGRLVFRRASDRTNTFIWRNLVVDHNTGALYVAGDPKPQQAKPLFETDTQKPTDPPPPQYSPYTYETYFTVNVISHGKSGPVGAYEYKRWGDVSASFDKFIADTQSATPAAAQIEVEKLLVARRSLDASEEIAKTIDQALGQWQAYGLRLVEEPKAAADKPATDPPPFTTGKAEPVILAAGLPDYASLSDDGKKICEASYRAMLSDAPLARLARGEAVATTVELIDMIIVARKPDIASSGDITKEEPGDFPLQIEEFDLAVRRLWSEAVGKFRIPVTGAEGTRTQATLEGAFKNNVTFTEAYLANGKLDDLKKLLDDVALTLKAKDCATVMSRQPRSANPT